MTLAAKKAVTRSQTWSYIYIPCRYRSMVSEETCGQAIPLSCKWTQVPRDRPGVGRGRFNVWCSSHSVPRVNSRIGTSCVAMTCVDAFKFGRLISCRHSLQTSLEKLADAHTAQAHAFTLTGTRHRHMLSPWQAHGTGTCLHLVRHTAQEHAFTLTGAGTCLHLDRHTTQAHAFTLTGTRYRCMPSPWQVHDTATCLDRGDETDTRHSHMPWETRWDGHVAKAHTLTDAC